jgi:hypothetical protein
MRFITTKRKNTTKSLPLKEYTKIRFTFNIIFAHINPGSHASSGIEFSNNSHPRHCNYITMDSINFILSVFKVVNRKL